MLTLSIVTSLAFATVAAAAPTTEPAMQWDDVAVGESPSPWGRDPPLKRYSSSDLVQTLYDEALPLLADRHSHVATLSTASQWRARQAVVRPRLEALFGPFPPPDRAKPPEFIHRGTVRGDGFTVDKLLVPTRPGYFVPASLWLPEPNASAVGKGSSNSTVPGILFAVGHEGPAFRWNGSDDWQNPGGEQIVQLNLVLRGFAVLSFDPLGQGERQMYPDLTGGVGSYASTLEHEFIARQAFLTGRSAASMWVWDMFVLMDVLATHPRVDATRLGDAGCSGGGTQVAYHASVDQRVSVASIACYISTFTVDFAPKGPWTAPTGGGGPADGEQTWPLAFAPGSVVLDKPDLVEIRAPRPTQVLLTTLDQCFPIAGGEAAVNESSAAYAALGDAGALWSHRAHHWHGYVNGNREALYAFMMVLFNHSSPLGSKELFNVTKTVFDPTLGYDRNIMPSPPYLTCAQLQVTSTGNVLTAPEAGPNATSAHDVVRAVVRELAGRLAAKRAAAGGAAFLDEVRATAADVAGVRVANATAPRGSSDSSAAGGAPPTPAPTVLSGEGRCRIPVAVTRPPPSSTARGGSGSSGSGGGGSQRGGAVVYVTGPPAAWPNASFHDERVAAIARAGFTVLRPVLCGLEAGGVYDVTSKLSTSNRAAADLAQGLNRSVVGIHAADVMRVCRHASAALGLNVRAVVAHEQMASAALHAAVISPQDAPSVAAVGFVASYELSAGSRLYSLQDDYAQIFGVLGHYDVPDLVAAACERGGGALVAGPTDAVHAPLALSDVHEAFGFAVTVLGPRLTLTAGTDVGVVVGWLSGL